MIPALVIGGVVEQKLREDGIKEDYARLDSGSSYEEKQAVQDLIKGCEASSNYSWIPDYIAERLFGNCRSLDYVDLNGANLSNTNLSGTNLRNANLMGADLIESDLSDADLSGANLMNANLINANLMETNLNKNRL